MNDIKYVVMLAVLTSVILFQYAPNCGLIYDGGMYASLAYSLYKNQEYIYNAATGDLPPMFPLLLAFSLFFGEKGINYVAPIFSALLVIAAFLFLRRENKAIYAFLGSLIVLFHPSVFEYSITIARDVPVLFFTLTCYLIYFNRREAPPIASALLGVFMALAFLSTYSALIYFLPIFIHAALNRKKSVLLAIAVAVILIFPWAAWSQAAHGTPLKEHSAYLIKYAGTKHFRYFISFILPLFIFYFFVPTVTAILGIVEEAREKKLAVIKNPYLQLLALAVLLNSIWPEQDIRYLFPALISILYFSFKFFSSIEKEKLVAVILLISLSLQVVLTINIASGVCPSFVLLEDAGQWLRSDTDEDAKLMAGSFYQIHYFSQRKTYQIPGNLLRAVKLIEQENIRYVVVDTYEKTTPPFAYELNYTIAKKFKDSYGEVWIYKP